LQNSYNATLEGWARALDLRDKETENHTQRVTQLAPGRGAADGSEQRRRSNTCGAARFLHDIGKMGIPDRILLKPDKLTDAEWAIMRQHPSFAFDLLSPIAYPSLRKWRFPIATTKVGWLGLSPRVCAANRFPWPRQNLVARSGCLGRPMHQSTLPSCMDTRSGRLKYITSSRRHSL